MHGRRLRKRGTCVYIYIYMYVHQSIHPSIHPYVRTYIHACINTYIHAYMPTYISAYIRTDGRTDVHAYTHSCIYATFMDSRYIPSCRASQTIFGRPLAVQITSAREHSLIGSHSNTWPSKDSLRLTESLFYACPSPFESSVISRACFDTL